MADTMVDVTLHIDEKTTYKQRENFRDSLLDLDGVMAVAVHDDKPHLFVIEYDPAIINSMAFIRTAEKAKLHAQLLGL